MPELEIVLGPPGTGKTTRLLEMLSQFLDKGGSPERVAFVSFSRRAIKEVAEKIGLDAEKFPHFRTIHSTAYHFLGLDRDDVIQYKHMRQFSELLGLPFSSGDTDDPVFDGTVGDRCMALYNLARARGTDIEVEWRRAMLPDLTLVRLKDVVRQYERFKSVNALWDFHDMVLRADGRLPVDLLFVDEAQDTSRAQWEFLRRAAKEVPNVVIAGDDDQAVYEWSGADVRGLSRFEGKRTYLRRSRRLPEDVKRISDRILQRIRHREAKEFEPRIDADGNRVHGQVTYRSDPDTLDLRGKGKWLLLARSNYQLEQFREMARRQGVVYTLPDGTWSWSLPAVRAAVTYERLRKGKELPRAEVRSMLQFTNNPSVKLPPMVVWSHLYGETALDQTWMDALVHINPSDKEYIRALRKGGESVTEGGRVRIGTVHSVKGAEADHVVLTSDISHRVAHGARIDPDAEFRVQYVGVTRAREALHIILPSTSTFWTF